MAFSLTKKENMKVGFRLQRYSTQLLCQSCCIDFCSINDDNNINNMLKLFFLNIEAAAGCRNDIDTSNSYIQKVNVIPGT